MPTSHTLQLFPSDFLVSAGDVEGRRNHLGWVFYSVQTKTKKNLQTILCDVWTFLGTTRNFKWNGQCLWSIHLTELILNPPISEQSRLQGRRLIEKLPKYNKTTLQSWSESCNQTKIGQHQTIRLGNNDSSNQVPTYNLPDWAPDDRQKFSYTAKTNQPGSVPKNGQTMRYQKLRNPSKPVRNTSITKRSQKIQSRLMKVLN